MNEKPHVLCAGAARCDITTDVEDSNIRDPLFSKTLVLDDGVTRIAIVSMDTTAIGGRQIGRGCLDDVSEEFLPRLRDRVEQELGIPGHHVLVNASHTHPPGRQLCDDDEQVDRIFDAVHRAAENMVPVQVGSGSGREDRISMNRTLRLKNGKHWTIRHSNPSPPVDEIEDVGPIDPEIGLVRIDRLDGRPLAVLYNFACHPMFGNPQGAITADYPGVASGVIEQHLGHDAIALFLQGAAGDVIDVAFKEFNRPRNIEPHGVMLGLSVLKAWREIRTGDAALRIVSETVDLPRRTDIPARVSELVARQDELLASLRFTTLDFNMFLPLYLKAAQNPDDAAERARRNDQANDVEEKDCAAMESANRHRVDKYLHSLRAMEELARIQDDIQTLKKHQGLNDEAGKPTIPAEVQGIRIGDCVLITFPAEVLTEIGLNVKKASPYKHTFLAAFSNGYLHYGPPAADYDKGGYEVTECLLAPAWQRIFEEKAQAIISRL
jgi:hypothetical protein